ncbi:MAG: helix-turn-helix transcriptional regulator [Selenomonadaceae bacterium]|nr:helix-turn-helix transcriptional regulator [Selenomonadaceae bacterium]
METFGQKIKRLRKAKKMTQSELAESVGVDFTYISKIENGKSLRTPAESTIRKLAMFLETNAEELILLAKKVPQNFQETIVDDKLAVDFLRIFPKLNETQRGIVEKIIEQAEKTS